jgi:hypothetical protein
MLLAAGLHLAGLETGLMAFFALQGMDQFGFFDSAGYDATCLGDVLDLIDSHVVPPL